MEAKVNSLRLLRTLLGLTMTAFLAVTVTGVNSATSQMVVKAEDLIGTWEMVSERDPKTGAVTVDASTALGWTMFTRSHWTSIGMRRDRNVIKADDFAKLSPEEKRKINYARVWNEKDQPIFNARAGTYTIVGDKVHETPTIPLDTRQIGADRVLKITRLDKDTMIVQTEDPPELAYPAVEYTYRRID
jgi:hypothetical protein